MKKSLYEFREEGVVNVREVELEKHGDLVVSGYDMDSAMEQFIGDDEWEGEARVKAMDVPLVLEALRKELGPGELVDLIARKFGGSIKAMTLFEEWLKVQAIPYCSELWS